MRVLIRVIRAIRGSYSLRALHATAHNPPEADIPPGVARIEGELALDHLRKRGSMPSTPAAPRPKRLLFRILEPRAACAMSCGIE